jgi:hypothetical protein
MIAMFLAAAALGCAADFSGNWIAEIQPAGLDPQYARVALRIDGSAVTGLWNQLEVKGTASGSRLTLTLVSLGSNVGTMILKASGNKLAGEGKARIAGRGGMVTTEAKITLTRPAERSGGPRTVDENFLRLLFGEKSARAACLSGRYGSYTNVRRERPR